MKSGPELASTEHNAGLLEYSLLWDVSRDTTSPEEVDNQVERKLKALAEALQKRKPSTILLWGTGQTSGQTPESLLEESGHLTTDIRTIKEFPPVEDSSMLSAKSLIEIMKRLDINESEYQNPELPEVIAISDFGAQRDFFLNKVVPTNMPGIYFHVLEMTNPVAYSVKVVFLTSGKSYKDKVALRFGEKPNVLRHRIPLLRRFFKG